MSEIELIERARSGDHEAFLDLLARYDRQIMSVVYRFTGDLYDREDLYQEVFMHCFKGIGKYKGDAAFGTWLTRLALNRCISYMKRKPVVAVPEEPAAPPPDYEKKARVAAVRRAMSRLRGSQQLSFFLYYIEDWSLERIAEVLGTSQGTVKSHLDRARTKIKADREVSFWKIR